MSDFFGGLRSAFTGGLLSSFSILDIIDIVIMTVLIYQVLKFFKNTKAIHVLKGLALLIIALAVASWLGLPTTTWMLSSIFTSGILIIVVLFQPELRKAFENLGRNKFTSFEFSSSMDKSIEEVIKACDDLSRRKVGALMVFQKKSGLGDIISTGTLLNADISSGLIENIFEPNTPLHDGAMVVRGNTIVSAGCFLPLSENNSIEKTLGTRHRAALGMSERSDAFIIVVSEETGVISVASKGELIRYLDLETVKKLLTEVYQNSRGSSLSGALGKVFGKDGDKDE